MGDFIDIASVTDVPPGRARTFDAGDRRIAVYHTARGFYASDNTCPHRGGPLGEGDVIGNEIVCPWHLWGFDVQTGVCAGNPDISIITHEVRVDGDRLLVKLSPVPATSDLM
ncbi:MAG TPA: Rieske 2Fe-2S domain-containing protein [Thermoanaerobaculia bacterium]|nr:Rieske 2Fe-2S domain-containing protein [Thermoanaerobaculia bacterium]